MEYLTFLSWVYVISAIINSIFFDKVLTEEKINKLPNPDIGYRLLEFKFEIIIYPIINSIYALVCIVGLFLRIIKKIFKIKIN